MKRMSTLLKTVFILTLLAVFLVNCELYAAGNKPVTEKLKKLLKDQPKIQKMLEKSISKAQLLNSDQATNPVRNLQDYYKFIDQASELIPQQVLNDPKELTRDQILQSICYFYFIISQPLPELKNKKLFKNSLQYYPPFSAWLSSFAETWGAFLDTENSWSKKTYQQFYRDPRFGLRKNWYESPLKWKTFNQFFSRKLRDPSVRPVAFPDDESIVVSPTDSRPQGAWKIDSDSRIMVDKGLKVKLTTYYNVNDLLEEKSRYKDAFADGILTHNFLNINDYHRFHFPVSGEVKEMGIVSGNVALEVKWDSKTKKYLPVDSTGWQFSQTRGYVILKTEKYGMVALVPIGMAQVSSVKFEKNIKIGARFKKGDNLGYFLFGGSDFIMIFQKIAGFDFRAPKQDNDSFKHILTGEAYGRMKGDKENLTDLQKIEALDKLAELLKLPPLSQVDKSVTKNQVDMMIYKEIEESGMPTFDDKKVREEAEKKFKLWKIGDQVQGVDTQGYKHEGVLKEKSGRYVKIGTIRIFSVDLSPDMLAHLDAKHQKVAVDKYIAGKKKIYYQKKRNFKTKLRDSVKAKYYKKYGFVCHSYKWMDYNTYRQLLERELIRRKRKQALKKKRDAERSKLEKKAEEEF
jgi:phosphatidylserine decarboxylase precursor